MTNLAKLKVSLTKHGAHKIAVLLKKFDKDAIMSNLWGEVPGVNIDAGQARKILSVGKDGTVPEVWNVVRPLGERHINALVFVGIVFSHKTLIDAMREGSTGYCIGSVSNGDILKGKNLQILHVSSKSLALVHFTLRTKFPMTYPNCSPCKN